MDTVQYNIQFNSNINDIKALFKSLNIETVNVTKSVSHIDNSIKNTISSIKNRWSTVNLTAPPQGGAYFFSLFE